MFFNLFKKKKSEPIEIIQETTSYSKSSILDKHFKYLEKIQFHYSNREKDNLELEKAIEYCKKQIEISKISRRAFLDEYNGDNLPAHTWFKQLAIIEEKRKNYQSAIDLSKQALEEWWNWDWEKRIERNEKKLLKK